jgi:hypothetical protein
MIPLSLSLSQVLLSQLKFDQSADEPLKVGVDKEMNEGYSKKFFEWLDAKLGIKHDRGYILFTDTGKDQIGYVFSTLSASSVNSLLMGYFLLGSYMSTTLAKILGPN